MQKNKGVVLDKKTVITLYFKKQFGCLLAAIVLLMLAILTVVIKTFLVSLFGEIIFFVVSISCFFLALLFFILTLISNLKMRSYLKKADEKNRNDNG